MRDLMDSRPIKDSDILSARLLLSSPYQGSKRSPNLGLGDMEAGEGSSGGGDKTELKYPLGFRFKPRPEELVEFYLLPKLQGKPSVPNDAIIEADVYECHPETLINQRYKDKGVDNVWYFLSPRTRKYRHGVRPSRRTADDLGRWKPSSGKEKKDPETAATETRLCNNGTIKYCVTSLAYHVGPPKNEKKTKWLMHEYTVPEYEIKAGTLQDGDMMLDKCALYVIYISNLYRSDDEDEDTSATCEEAGASSSSEPGAPAPESGEQTSAPTTTLSKKQAGKRPVVKQEPLDRATEMKRTRQLPTLVLGAPPAPMQGNGMGAPLRVGAAGCSYVVPGLQTPMPWPPVTGNRLQGPVQVPQRVYGQHNVRPVAAPPCYGQRQVRVQGLPGSSTMHPPSSVSANNHTSLGRITVMRPPLPPSGFGPTMMRLQNGPNLAGRQTPPSPSAAQSLPQLPGLDLNDRHTRMVISELITAAKAHHPRNAPPYAEQQQFPTASSNLPSPTQQQQPTSNAGASHPARPDATVPSPGTGRQQQHQQQPPQQSNPAIPATSVSGHGDAAAPADEKPASDSAPSELPVRGDKDGGSVKEAALDSNFDKILAELATMTMPAPGRGNVKEER